MWGKQSTFQNLNLRLRTAEPKDGCEAYSFKEPHHSTAFLVNGLKKCPLSTLIHNAQAHGANALFIVNNKDTNIQDIEVPDHLPGVNIHVFIINHSDGQAMIDITEQAQSNDRHWHTKSKIEVDFLEYAKRGSKVNLELVFSPDSREALKFLADTYSSAFSKDLGKKLNIQLRYSLLHCADCKKEGHKLPRNDCLSGGRYCMKSTSFENLNGQTMLIQTIKNMCTESVLAVKGREAELATYFYLFNANCIDTFSATCANSILTKLGIKEAVFDCLYGSFINHANRAELMTRSTKNPNVMLQDNVFLKQEMTHFKKIEHYAHFPLIKVNGIHFYGPISYYSVFGFICRHIDDSYEGCSSIFTEEEIIIYRNNRIFQLSIAGIIGLAVISTMFLCRRQMVKKFDTDLAYKVDQSVTEFLHKERVINENDEVDVIQPVEPVSQVEL